MSSIGDNKDNTIVAAFYASHFTLQSQIVYEHDYHTREDHQFYLYIND